MMAAITDKKALYDALARHVIAYPDPNPATGAPWTTAERIDHIMAIKAEVDAKLQEIEAAAEAAAAAEEAARQAEIDASVAAAQAVDAWLAGMRETDPERFEEVRRLSFEEQKLLMETGG